MQSNMYVGNYTLLYKIGSGSFGSVHMAINDINGYPVAIKQIDKSKLKTEKDQVHLSREISIMKNVIHQYIVELFEIIDEDDKIWIVMEHVQGGSLKSMLIPDQPLSEDTCRQIFSQIILALGYLHKNLKIMHRDLKAENILFDKNKHIRLIDFGLSTSLEPGVMRTSCGSPAYAAPEVILQSQYTESADIWSAGILLYLMSTGRFPFNNSSIPMLLNYIVNLPIEIPKTVSPELQDLIARILQKDPNKRITLEQIISHPWFVNHDYFSNKLIQIDNYFESDLIDDSLDLQIIDELLKKGVDIKALRESLMQKEVNSLTAVYRIMRRSKIMETYNSNIVHHHSQNNFYRFSSYPITAAAKITSNIPQSFSKARSEYMTQKINPRIKPKHSIRLKRVGKSIPITKK